MSKTTVILGASTNPERYAYLAAKTLLQHNHKVYLVGLKEKELFNQKIYEYGTHFKDIHTITVYLNPMNQKQYYQYIISLQPKRIIFNPGSENNQFYRILHENHIFYQEACTLVLLATNQY